MGEGSQGKSFPGRFQDTGAGSETRLLLPKSQEVLRGRGPHTNTQEVFRVGQLGEKLLSLRSHTTLGR